MRAAQTSDRSVLKRRHLARRCQMAFRAQAHDDCQACLRKTFSRNQALSLSASGFIDSCTKAKLQIAPPSAVFALHSPRDTPLNN